MMSYNNELPEDPHYVLNQVDEIITSMATGQRTVEEVAALVCDYLDEHDLLGNNNDELAKYAVALFDPAGRQEWAGRVPVGTPMYELMWAGLVPLFRDHKETFRQMLQTLDFVCSHGSDFFNEYTDPDLTMDAVLFLLEVQAISRPANYNANIGALKALYIDDPDYGYADEERVVTVMASRFGETIHSDA